MPTAGRSGNTWPLCPVHAAPRRSGACPALLPACRGAPGHAVTACIAMRRASIHLYTRRPLGIFLWLHARPAHRIPSRLRRAGALGRLCWSPAPRPDPHPSLREPPRGLPRVGGWPDKGGSPACPSPATSHLQLLRLHPRPTGDAPKVPGPPCPPHTDRWQRPEGMGRSLETSL